MSRKESEIKQERETVKERVKCILTSMETIGYSKQLASANQDASALKASVSMLSRKISDGYEYREVDCHWEFDLERGLKNLIREDTDEVVRTEVITADERQGQFGIAEEKE